MGQPEQKSYLELNSGWPAGSWSITEPSTGYQAKCISSTGRARTIVRSL